MSVNVELPAPVIEVGLKLMVTPDGWPVVDNAIAESKPLIAVLVIVKVEEPPCSTETAPEDAVRPNPGALIMLSKPLIRLLPLGLPHPVARS